MDKQKFIDGYCERSGVTWEWLSKYKTALPCQCGLELCEGWAMVSNDELSIKVHNELYAPNSKLTGERLAASPCSTPC